MAGEDRYGANECKVGDTVETVLFFLPSANCGLDGAGLPMPLILEAHDLVKHYPLPRTWRELISAPCRRKRKRALDGLSLRIESGERVALVGPNGAGKTTLARILCGVVSPETGSARVAGIDVAAGPAVRRLVGFARPDDPALHPRLDAIECLSFHAALHGVEGASIERALSAIAGAGELANRRVQSLSAGERAKISLAKALIPRPRLLVLDELSRVLDPGAASQVRRVLADFAREGRAVLVITHDLSEAALCDRVIVVRRGRNEADGPWSEVETAAREVFGI